MNTRLASVRLLAQLHAYRPHDGHEKAGVEKMISFLQSSSAPFSRSTPTGHVTVSAILVDHRLERTLLLWHKKLQRWLQPGGHCEPEVDTSLVDAALRELEEETGVRPAQLERLPRVPFDIDVHEIPARGSEGAHLHYDVRYLFKALGDSGLEIFFDREESGGYTWRRIADLRGDEDASISRFARKLADTAISTQSA